MADVNAVVESGTVTWTPYFGDPDSSDVGDRPDRQVINGTITFWPGQRGLSTFRINFPGIPETLFVRSFVAPIVNSELIAPGSEDLPVPLVMIASEQPAANMVTPMQWVAEFNITGLSKGDNPSPLVFNVPAGGEIDLATVVPQTASPAQVLVTDESTAIRAEQAADDAEAALDTLNQGVGPAVDAYLAAHPPETGLTEVEIADVTDSTPLSQSIVRSATAAEVRGLISAPEASAVQAAIDAQAAAINAKAPINNPTFTGTVNGITKTMVGLGNVDNTSDANKPVSTATATALGTKADTANPTFTGTVNGITKTHVGLGNVDNTSDANKPVSTATATALALKATIASPALTGNPTAPTPAAGDNDTSIATTAFVTAALALAKRVFDYDPATSTWEGPPISPLPVIFLSTNSITAVQPPTMRSFDAWVRHPDATI